MNIFKWILVATHYVAGLLFAFVIILFSSVFILNMIVELKISWNKYMDAVSKSTVVLEGDRRK